MTEQKRKENNWMNIRSVLSETLGKRDLKLDEPLDWLGYQWTLIGGKEVASISRVDRLVKKTLYVRVAGKEWFAPLKSISQKMIWEINRLAGKELLNRVVFQEKEAIT